MDDFDCNERGCDVSAPDEVPRGSHDLNMQSSVVQPPVSLEVGSKPPIVVIPKGSPESRKCKAP